MTVDRRLSRDLLARDVPPNLGMRFIGRRRRDNDFSSAVRILVLRQHSLVRWVLEQRSHVRHKHGNDKASSGEKVLLNAPKASLDVLDRSLQEKVQLAHDVEAATRASAASIQTAICAYTEILEEKVIVTSDGADCSFRLIRPEFRISGPRKTNRIAADWWRSRSKAAASAPTSGSALRPRPLLMGIVVSR